MMEARIVHLSVLELMVGSAACSAKLRRDGCEAQAFNIPERSSREELSCHRPRPHFTVGMVGAAQGGPSSAARLAVAFMSGRVGHDTRPLAGSLHQVLSLPSEGSLRREVPPGSQSWGLVFEAWSALPGLALHQLRGWLWPS